MQQSQEPEFTVAAPDDHVIRVSGKTPPHELAGAIANCVYEGNYPMLRAIGASAVNQAIKGVIVANQYVAARGLSLAFRPGFANVPGEQGGEISAVTIQTISV